MMLASLGCEVVSDFLVKLSVALKSHASEVYFGDRILLKAC